MAVVFGSVCITVILLTCVAGGEALELLRATETSGSEYKSELKCVHF